MCTAVLQVHTDEQVSVPLEAALATGELDVSLIMADSKPANCVPNTRNATFHLSTLVGDPDPSRADEHAITIGRYHTALENGTCVWRLTGQGDFLAFPKYFDVDLMPVQESSVPPELAKQAFVVDTNISSREFNGLGGLSLDCYDAPGPADPQLYCAQSKVNGYWLGWRWYRFVDQPALQRAGLNEEERTFLQQRVEALHGMVGRVSRWLKPGHVPAGSELAHVDPVALVTPPRGLEKGFVPIALWESPLRPKECVTHG